MTKLPYRRVKTDRHKSVLIIQNSIRIVVAGVLFAGMLGCKDQGSLPPTPKPASPISMGIDTLFSFPQDTVRITISGGTPPYSIPNAGSISILSCSIAGATIIVMPSGLGSDVIEISDASSPANTTALPVVVGAPVSFTNSIQPIFVSSYGCSGTVGGCHGGTMGMFLDNPTVSYQNLVSVPSQATRFAGLDRVTPRDLGRSVLYLRLSSNDPAIAMPQGRSVPFNSSYLSNVRTWILQGAHFN